MKKIALLTLLTIFYSLAFSQLNITELGKLSYSTGLSDIWGYVDSQNNEYALIGANTGFSVVDVTDPESLVEVFFQPGIESIWWDVKTWEDHAYVSTEGGGGILIVDLSPLPGEITSTTYFTGTIYPFSTSHNIYIDEFGKLYIFGADNSNGGAIICDLTTDPMNPVELGRFDNYYLHDGMARGDTLWGGALYEGVLAAIDVSDPENTVLMGTVSTPNQFTHNAWVSDNGKNVFTSDEVGGAFIAAYDVNDLENMFETDRVQSSPGANVIPHNVHVNNDFLVTSYYADGVIIHDASRPGNVIETGNYDTAPNYSGDGYNGCWGAYPFLPSGNILASDMQEGLYVLQPDYKRACYVEGIVTDSITGLPINNVTIEILETGYNTTTGFGGEYAFGTPEAGTYDISFSHIGYPDHIIEGVELENGVLTTLDVELSSWYTDIADNVVSNQVIIYPNPFTSEITLEMNFAGSATKDLSLQLFDLTGKLISEQSVQGNKENVHLGASLPKGTYIVNIMSGNELITSKRISKR